MKTIVHWFLQPIERWRNAVSVNRYLLMRLKLARRYAIEQAAVRHRAEKELAVCRGLIETLRLQMENRDAQRYELAPLECFQGKFATRLFYRTDDGEKVLVTVVARKRWHLLQFVDRTVKFPAEVRSPKPEGETRA